MELIFHSKVTSLKEARVTVAAIIDGSKATFGVSRCSAKDQFVRKVGRLTALKRAKESPIAGIYHVPKKELSKWFITTAKGMSEIIKVNPELI
jgi:hypothetical protein